jgi:hypothetical protein
MSRPKKSAPDTRPHVVAFRLNDAELARLQSEAGAAGVAASDAARAKVTGAGVAVRLGRSPRRATPPPESPAMFQLRQELSRVGVNLNQIARRLHMTGEHQPDELKDACRDVDEILRRMLADDAFR